MGDAREDKPSPASGSPGIQNIITPSLQVAFVRCRIVEADYAEPEEVYLMSIRPQYASAILSGRKKYELRKLSGLHPIEEGALIVIYSSGKVKSIIGEFRAGRVIVGTPELVWAHVSRPGMGIGGDAYAYIRGAKRAMAIEVREPRAYPQRVSLEEIRRLIPGWMPPFSYKKLEPGDRIYELIIRRLRARLL